MKVEIVVPVINLWAKYTKPAIDSLLVAMMRAKSHGIDTHIVLVDNASTDETQSEALKLNTDLIYYQRNEERWGFQKSTNFGVNYGFEHGADLAFVCNNDIIMHPEAIWRLVERFGKGDVGMATCMDVSGEMRENGIIPILISTMPAKDKESVDDAPHPCFSAFMLSKECWELVGELDEGFAPAYFEDNDYHYRMQVLDIMAIVHPPAMFFHFASRTQLEAGENGTPIVSNAMFENSRAYFMTKWGGMPTEEKYKHPFNDENKSVKSTKQNP